jgi:hypothetical protein
MMILNYKSKKEIKDNIGKALKYTETSLFGEEYLENGIFCGCNRPFSPEYPFINLRGKREYFAEITMENGLIKKVK